MGRTGKSLLIVEARLGSFSYIYTKSGTSRLRNVEECLPVAEIELQSHSVSIH